MPEPAKSTSAVLDRLAAESPTATAEDQNNPAVPTGEAMPATPAEETPTEETPTEEGAEEAVETEPDLEATPSESGNFSKFKDTFKTHPELRAIVGREAAFAELFPSFSEAKQIRSWFPTLEDAETVFNEAERHRNAVETFKSDPEKYLESLKESDTNAYATLLRTVPEILSRTDSDSYTHQARAYTGTVLENIAAFAQQQGNEELLAAVQKVAWEGLGTQLGAPGYRSQRPDAVNSELEKLRREKSERETRDRESQFETFTTSANADYAEQAISAIETQVKGVLKTAGEGQVKRIVKEIYDKLQDRMKAQPQTVAQVKSVYDNARKGKNGLSEQKSLVEFLVRRAKAAIPILSKEVIDEWSKSVLATQKAEIQKKKDIAAQTKDVGAGMGGGAAATGAARPNGRPRTSTSILDDLQSGRYQAPTR